MDEKLRHLQRQAVIAGTPEAYSKVLAEELRIGLITQDDVNIRAFFDDPIAQYIVGKPEKLTKTVVNQERLFEILSRWLALIIRNGLHQEIKKMADELQFNAGWGFDITEWNVLLSGYRVFRILIIIIQDINRGEVFLSSDYHTILVRAYHNAVIYNHFIRCLDPQAEQIAFIHREDEVKSENYIDISCRENYHLFRYKYNTGHNDDRLFGSLFIMTYVYTRMRYPSINWGEQDNPRGLIPCLQKTCQFTPKTAILALTQAANQFNVELSNKDQASFMLDYLINGKDWIVDELEISRKILALSEQLNADNMIPDDQIIEIATQIQNLLEYDATTLRRNPDEKYLQLERLAAIGDQNAIQSLVRLRQQINHPIVEEALSLKEEILCLLDEANGRRRVRILSYNDVIWSLEKLLNSSYAYYYTHGGDVPNSYGYPASNTLVLVTRFNNEIKIGITECHANKITPGRCWSRVSPWREGTSTLLTKLENWHKEETDNTILTTVDILFQLLISNKYKI